MFGGMARHVTRQRLYAGDEATFNPDTIDHVPARRRDRTSDFVDDGSDPYAESGYTHVAETPEAIDQWRADVTGPRFRELAAQRAVVVGNREYATAEQLATQRRAAMLAAMDTTALSEQAFFSTDYAACVPKEFRHDFLAAIEVTSVCSALVPAMYTRYHLTEEAWRRSLEDMGARFKHARTHALRGQHCHDDHAHYDAATNTTPMRVLTFQIATTAAATAVDDGQQLDRRRPSDVGYYVRLVAHVVAEDVVCFRSFHFARRDTNQ